MFIARESLELLILSILDESFPDGLSSYDILTKTNERKGFGKSVSAGTLYPKLEVLAKSGLIEQDLDNKVWKITPKGKSKMINGIPDFLDKSIEMIPTLLRAFMRPLPPHVRAKYLSTYMPSFCGGHGCSPAGISDPDFLLSGMQFSGTQESIDALERIKNQLEESKKNIEARYAAELNSVEALITRVDEKIERCKDSKDAPRRTIPVEGDDDESKD
jgi:DNA-binding PadR family transcriptional regulator